MDEDADVDEAAQGGARGLASSRSRSPSRTALWLGSDGRGLVLSAGTGRADRAMTFRGTLDDINRAVERLVYRYRGDADYNSDRDGAGAGPSPAEQLVGVVSDLGFDLLAPHHPWGSARLRIRRCPSRSRPSTTRLRGCG